MYLRNMQVHLLIALHLGIMFFEAAASALDLNSAAGFLLDVLDVRSASSDNLGAQVESRNGLEIDGNALFGPLAASQMVAFDLWLLFSRAAEAALVDQIGQLLLHHFFDLLDSLFEAFLGGARYVKVERRVLGKISVSSLNSKSRLFTHRSGGHALVRVVISSRGDILKHVSLWNPKVIKQSFMDGSVPAPVSSLI